MPDTRHYVSDAELQRMKPSAILINASRGPVVDSDALVRALGNRQIWAAGLDVVEGEPRVPAALLELPNVVLTPHVASSTRTRMAVIAAENTVAALTGQRPRHVVNPEVLPE
jgi:phosphoglycerate dehydrogenase-like enzyme